MNIYIYKITNLVNGKVYIGQHKDYSKIVDNYLGSGSIIKSAIKKYGKENFEKKILEYCTNDNVNDREIYWIKKYNSLVPNGYNITKGGDHAATTQDTIVYNNGKSLKYVKIGDVPPEGYVKGPLQLSLEWRKSVSTGSKGKNQGHIPWNKGKHLENESVKLNGYLSGKTMRDQGMFSGANNPRALTYEITSPTGEKFHIVGEIKKFCKDHHLSYRCFKRCKNNGSCSISKSVKGICAKNTVGWTFTVIDDNCKEKARERREFLRKSLYLEGKLTKRQTTISKLKLHGFLEE